VLKSLVTSPQLRVLEQALEASSLRHKLISNNIANVNTPGYKRSDVNFAAALQATLAGMDPGSKKLPLRATHERHIVPARTPLATPVVVTDTNTSVRRDDNNVDIDIEMANMAMNTIYYQAVAQMVNRYFANISTAITEGRR